MPNFAGRKTKNQSTMTNVKTNSIKAWLLAARPKTLTGAAIPVMLGCALAFIYGHFQFCLLYTSDAADE